MLYSKQKLYLEIFLILLWVSHPATLKIRCQFNAVKSEMPVSFTSEKWSIVLKHRIDLWTSGVRGALQLSFMSGTRSELNMGYTNKQGVDTDMIDPSREGEYASEQPHLQLLILLS